MTVFYSKDDEQPLVFCIGPRDEIDHLAKHLGIETTLEWNMESEVAHPEGFKTKFGLEIPRQDLIKLIEKGNDLRSVGWEYIIDLVAQAAMSASLDAEFRSPCIVCGRMDCSHGR